MMNFNTYLTQLQNTLKGFTPAERDEIITEIRKKYWQNFQWQELPSWPGPERAFNITVAQHNGEDNCIYVISGRRLTDSEDRSSYDYLSDVYEFNPAFYDRGMPYNKFWRQRADAPVSLMAGSGSAVGQSHIVIHGGADGSLVEKAEILKDEHPGFPKTAWIYHTITNTWVNGGDLPLNQVTTTAVNWQDKIIIPSGEIKPRRRTADIWQFSLRSLLVLILIVSVILAVVMISL